MEVILFILVIILIFVIHNLNKKINFLLNNISGLFWALKNKKILDLKDMEEGRKIAKGEKMAPLSLKDFMSKEKHE